MVPTGEHLNYVAIHQYWLPCWNRELRPDYLDCIMLSEGPEQTITDVIDVIEEAGYRGRIKIAFDEWNLRGWHHPGFPRKAATDPEDTVSAAFIDKRELNSDPSQYSMADALFSASFLNACLRHAEDVGMANIAPIVNTRGPLYVHRHGVVRRTTFHTLAMYANELKERIGRLDLEAGMLVQGKRFIPMIDGVATVDRHGDNWAVALVNRHPSEHIACTVKMNAETVEGTYKATILTGDSAQAYNDVDNPDRVVPEKTQLTSKQGSFHLPPHSLTILRIPR